MGAISPEELAADLATGDARAAAYDWSGAAVHRVRSTADPLFRPAYEMLWGEFGTRAEMERRAVIESRFRWSPLHPIDGHSLLYEMIVVVKDGQIAAVRDHTAILRIAGNHRRERPNTVVHLSHSLVAPSHRRTGLAGWLRGLPLQAARECAAAASERSPGMVNLVAEMDPPDAEIPARMIRLTAYEKAGFLKVDPAAVDYRQPDFRGPGAIDETGLQPLPLVLIVRRVGAEGETTMPGREIHATIRALYTMYGVHLREKDMRPMWEHLERMPAGDEPVALVPPTR